MYNYSEQKQNVFTEQGHVMYNKIRDKAKELLKLSGAVKMDKLLCVTVGDSWTMFACVDRMVEMKEIEEITIPGSVAGQDRVFISVTI